ncbi:DnaD domain-containing protein [Lacticaseibacillus brantae]|uniref:DNA replication protein DnaD n=1 Tax=Lacticaseibacillus brantae DSM 23927 TaxID=1423727 RepID=A0A0R2AZD1_9LACO|nr:DnaD domain protein [Lacticaseibacillus brantae]KRM72673.1 DNA replication protein DnaD [Lacticaseibacillus brantae DSM 23927]
MDELNRYLTAGQTNLSNLIFQHFSETNLTQQELVAYLYLSFWQQNYPGAPDLTVLAQMMKIKPNDFFILINNLIQKQAIQLKSQEDANGRMQDEYDLAPLIERLLPAGGAKTVVQPPKQTDVFSEIEVEFGRPLSPIEQQTIQQWLQVDHYQPDLIHLALREAVLNQAYSLRYMDRILLNWEKRHLTTVQQVQAAKEANNGL